MPEAKIEFFRYSRAQAIADGCLVDVSETAKEAGIVFPTAVTKSVWERHVRVPDAVDWQDEGGRLWDVLWMFRCAANQKTDRLEYQLLVQNAPNEHELVTLKAVCGPEDGGEPVITIMLPHEE